MSQTANTCPCVGSANSADVLHAGQSHRGLALELVTDRSETLEPLRNLRLLIRFANVVAKVGVDARERSRVQRTTPLTACRHGSLDRSSTPTHQPRPDPTT